MADPSLNQSLMPAGPTPLPPAVSQAMAQPMLYHRAPAFVPVYARALERLKLVFQTSSDVLLFASSGSGAMESAVANMVRPGEPALVASCGKFGERWADLCDAYGADTIHWETEWGQKVDPAELDRRLAANRGVEVVFVTASETSTGVVNDVRALTAVDAVSVMGAVPLSQDEWGVDVVVSGSQKALMSPPGLAFASPNEAALERAASVAGRRHYFDWGPAVAGQRKDPPDSPFTPAVGLVQALDVALGLIEREENANVVTAIKLPETIDGAVVPKLMRDSFGVTIAGGQGRLKGRIARIAHCGYFGAFDIVVTMAAFEMTLRRLGHEAELGTGVAAAQRVLLEAGLPAPSAA